MLPRRLRLSRASFATSKGGVRLTSPHFSVSLARTANSGGCAAIISKKVARLAVTRHRLKRRILVVLRPWCKKEYALTVFAKTGCASLPFQTLKEELSVLLGRLFANL
jgi:ribonuclease P protein component